MASKKFNTILGYSVGSINPIDIVDSNANIYANALTANGVVSFNSANVSLGPVANVHIGGGTNGFVLTTDGLGNLSWKSGGGGGGNLIVNMRSGTTVNIPIILGYLVVNGRSGNVSVPIT